MHPVRPGLIADVAASELRVGAQYDWPGLHLAYLGGDCGKLASRRNPGLIHSPVEDVGS